MTPVGLLPDRRNEISRHKPPVTYTYLVLDGNANPGTDRLILKYNGRPVSGRGRLGCAHSSLRLLHTVP